MKNQTDRIEEYKKRISDLQKQAVAMQKHTDNLNQLQEEAEVTRKLRQLAQDPRYHKAINELDNALKNMYSPSLPQPQHPVRQPLPQPPKPSKSRLTPKSLEEAVAEANMYSVKIEEKIAEETEE